MIHCRSEYEFAGSQPCFPRLAVEQISSRRRQDQLVAVLKPRQRTHRLNEKFRHRTSVAQLITETDFIVIQFNHGFKIKRKFPRPAQWCTRTFMLPDSQAIKTPASKIVRRRILNANRTFTRDGYFTVLRSTRALWRRVVPAL